jgi:cytoskeletal protein RodZ
MKMSTHSVGAQGWFLRRVARILLVVALLLVTAHRLPAPIQEVPESPTPAPHQSTKPKLRSSPKPKSKSTASEPVPHRVSQQPSAKPSRFAGTWAGTIYAFPNGNMATVLTVDSTEKTMALTAPGSTSSSVSNAKLNGDMLKATFPTGWPVPITFSLTPEPNGATARVRLQGFLIDSTAVFHRIVAESSPPKSPR